MLEICSLTNFINLQNANVASFKQIWLLGDVTQLGGKQRYIYCMKLVLRIYLYLFQCFFVVLCFNKEGSFEILLEKY